MYIRDILGFDLLASRALALTSKAYHTYRFIVCFIRKLQNIKAIQEKIPWCLQEFITIETIGSFHRHCVFYDHNLSLEWFLTSQTILHKIEISVGFILHNNKELPDGAVNNNIITIQCSLNVLLMDIFNVIVESVFAHITGNFHYLPMN